MKTITHLLATLGFAMAAHAGTPAENMAAKVRSALGGDAALNAVKSVRFEITAKDGDDKPLGVLITEYKAPMKLREIDYTRQPLELVYAIDGREGHRVIRRLDNGNRRVEIMTAAEVDARRDFANANLHFMAAPSPERGSLSLDTKPVSIDGIECAVLAFQYKSGFTLRRFIDPATSRLVASRIDFSGKPGELMVNRGEQKVAGITYPKEIEIRDASGKTQRKLSIAKIEVNPELADAAFTTPLF